MKVVKWNELQWNKSTGNSYEARVIMDKSPFNDIVVHRYDYEGDPPYAVRKCIGKWYNCKNQLHAMCLLEAFQQEKQDDTRQPDA